MRKNVAGQYVAFQMNSATDGSAVTSGTPTVYYTINGGTQGTGSGTAAHEGNGQWSYAPAQAETNGNHVAFTMVISGAISQTVNVWPVSFDPTDSVRLGLTALPNAAAGSAGGLPTDSSGKTSFNDLSAAQVNAECDTALADYDALVPADLPTNFADMAITATTGRVTVGTNADKAGYSISGAKTTLDSLNDISVSDVLTTQMTESYAADGTAPTLAQALFLIQQMATEKAISGTTATIKKLDGSTTAATLTLDDATSPTSITRSS